ncbi:MAG: zinc ribbon domain-containing protein, partial [Pseudomonas sp.]
MFSPSFCPKCGGNDLRSQLPPGDTHERLMCRGCGYIHYI